MKLKMTVQEAIDFARERSRGMTLHEDSQGWRVVCMVLADEVERLQSQQPVVRDQLSLDYLRECARLGRENEELKALAQEMANDIEREVRAKFTDQVVVYQSMRHAFDLEMDVVHRARAILATGKECLQVAQSGDPS